MRQAANWGIVLLIALLFTVAPGGDATLGLILTVIAVAFFTAIGFVGYRLFREHRFTLETMPDLDRGVLYAAVGLAFLAFAAAARLFDEGGVFVLLWIALLGLASYGVFWVWQRRERY